MGGPGTGTRLLCFERFAATYSALPPCSTPTIRAMGRPELLSSPPAAMAAYPAALMPFMCKSFQPRKAPSRLRTSLMYVGTSADDSPMAAPVRKRPASMVLRSGATEDSSGPANMGPAASRKEARRPRLSATPPPASEPRAAPASVLLTI